MVKPWSCMQFIKSRIFLLQVTRESVSVLQVTWESVSGTASHTRCIWKCNEIEGSYDKIIITIVPSYTGKNITCLLPLALLLVLRTRNNTDGNKLVIFSSIASYYGDNYIVTPYSYTYCSAAISNSYISPWGVVVLHIGVGRSPTSMGMTTPRWGI